MKQLTWADVVHYYMRNNPKPTVWGPDNGEGDYEIVKWDDKFPMQFFNPSYTHYLEDMLPELTDIADITEEDAIGFCKLNGLRSPYDWENEEMSAQDYVKSLDYGFEDKCFSAKSIDYLVQRNYNVFNIATWKEPKP